MSQDNLKNFYYRNREKIDLHSSFWMLNTLELVLNIISCESLC